MCLITWRWLNSADTKLIVLANRDEFFARPTAPMSRWHHSTIWAGRDLQAGGTWLGVNHVGRLAALTNYRAPYLQRDGTPSRGDLVKDFLESDKSVDEFIDFIFPEAGLYNPFNLLLYDTVKLLGFESRVHHHRRIEFANGFGNVSNGNFNEPWPKSIWLQDQMALTLDRKQHTEEELLDLLLNAQKAPISKLPQTGIETDREIALSSPFISLSDYGTRASSLIEMTSREIRLYERSFDIDGITQKVAYRIPIHQ